MWAAVAHLFSGGALIGFRGLMLQVLSEKHNSFLRLLKKKDFKEERVTTIGWYAIDKSTTLESNKSLYHMPLSTLISKASWVGDVVFEFIRS